MSETYDPDTHFDAIYDGNVPVKIRPKVKLVRDVEALTSGQKEDVRDALDVVSQAELTAALLGEADLDHTHTIANVTGLQTALDGKAASSHSHAISDTTGLQTALDGKAASSHTHAQSDITGLTAALDAKAATTSVYTVANAVGDGVYAATGTATNGDATFTATGVTWTIADIGKAIVIAGAGAAGVTLSTTIASINSSTSIELTVAPSTTVSGTAKFYYGTDDTTAIQSALDATPDGGFCLLRAGKIYMASNLKLDGGFGGGGFLKKGFGTLVGMATIAAIGTGSSGYLVAAKRWVTGDTYSTFGESPWHLTRLKIDAFGLKDLAYVHKMYDSCASYCEFSNAKIACYRITRQNQDASLGTTAYLSGTHLFRCLFTTNLAGLNPTYGFHSQGAAADISQAPTDGTMTDCAAFGVTGTSVFGVAMMWDNTGGWTVEENRTFSCTEGVNVYQWGKNSAFSGNNWDADSGVAFRVGRVGTYIDYASIHGDNFYTDLVVDFTDDTSVEVFTVQDCTFYFDPQETTSGIGGDGQARIVHNRNRATKTIRSVDNYSQAETFHRRSAGNTLGVFDVFGYGSVEDSTNYQRQFHDSGATGVVDRALHDSASPAASDIINAQIYAGRDSGGNVTDYVQTEALITDPTNGSEDAAWRVRALVGGALTQRFRLDENGCWVGASNATGIPSAGAAAINISGLGFSDSNANFARYSADASGLDISFYKSRGAAVGTHTVTVSGDTIARIVAYAADGSTSRPAARIDFQVDGTPGSSDMPGRIVFLTTADGAATVTERMRITNAGNVVVNTAAIATNATDGFLYVPSCAGTPTGTPTAFTGRVPIVVDTTNNKLYFYSGGAWRDAGP